MPQSVTKAMVTVTIQQESGPSKKRNATDVVDEETTQKKQKVHPFFAAGGAVKKEGPIKWSTLGPRKTCLYGVYLEPKSSAKVAAFDLDGTIITGPFPGGKPRQDAEHWAWWQPNVATKLKELHTDGYAITFVSNQSRLKGDKMAKWKTNVEGLSKKLGDLPFRIFTATAKDNYRKPMPGVWEELTRILGETPSDVEADLESSLFVGDAAGRDKDFADSDRKWALNIGIPFFTPEEYFLGKPAAPFKLSGFDPKAILETSLPRFLPSNAPLFSPTSKQEIILFVGFPCLGKTTLYQTMFEPKGYKHVNQDTLKSRDKCLKVVEASLNNGESCVVDNTNRDQAVRKHYTTLAKRMNVDIRCFYFEGKQDLAWHNNLYRAYIAPPTTPPRDLIPISVFSKFAAELQVPEKTEGFTEVRRVNWVFEGSEEEKRRWSMWLTHS